MALEKLLKSSTFYIIVVILRRAKQQEQDDGDIHDDVDLCSKEKIAKLCKGEEDSEEHDSESSDVSRTSGKSADQVITIRLYLDNDDHDAVIVIMMMAMMMMILSTLPAVSLSC